MRHVDVYKKRAKDTGLWLLGGDTFRKWRESDAVSALWLYGMPGCGNSVLTSMVVEHVKHRNNPKGDDTALAYFYFDFNNRKTSTVGAMLRSLISQLLAWNGKLPASLEESAWELLHGWSNQDAASTMQYNFSEPSIDDLLDMLRATADECADINIVLDALDECVDMEELLKCLQQIMSFRANGLRILLSSKPVPELSTTLEA